MQIQESQEEKTMAKIKLPKCGKNQRQGPVTHGFGLGGTKRAAKQAACSMAQAFAAAIADKKLPDFVCPDTCPEKKAEGIVNLRFTERVNVNVAPGVFICVVSLTYDFIILCEAAG
jgi:hypothetical protein